MADVQPGILAPVPGLARYLTFTLRAGASPGAALSELAAQFDGDKLVVGVGQSTLLRLGVELEGLHAFPTHVGTGFAVPATPADLWCWLRGDDRGELVHLARALERRLGDAFELTGVIDAYRYGSGLDMTGYEDGTENPLDQDAVDVAVVADRGAGLDGSSFVAVQQWVHDLGYFQSLTTDAQDDIIGRRISDNEEIDEAPASAHVKRTAQESFDPEAFVVRRSMPWADGTSTGLIFVAFGHSLDAFEALLNRMVGAEDGIVDGLFQFTRPVTGAYFWCPPVASGRLDLQVIGL